MVDFLERIKERSRCKGINEDGTPCIEPAGLPNGYCCYHQSQAPPWTRDLLQAVIEDHGGSHGLDLAGADLSDLDLSHLDLPGIVLGRFDSKTRSHIAANLTGTKLLGTNLQGAHMSRVLLQGADLSLAKLHSAGLMEANLTDATLMGTDLHDAGLQGAVLRVRHFSKDPTFVGRLMSDILPIPGPNLQGARLDDADLRGADLRSARMQGAHLERADLREAYLRSARMQGAHLERADLRGSDLMHVNLRGADLRYANLEALELRDVAEDGLLEVRLYRAKLDRTVLRRDQLGAAIGDELAGEYREARDAYLALKQNFDDLGDYAASAWAYQRERRMEKAAKAPWRCRKYYGDSEPFPVSTRRFIGRVWGRFREYGDLPRWSPLVWWFWLKHFTLWLTDWFVELLCGYGESTRRVLFWMVVSLLGFATYYHHIQGILLVEPDGSRTIAASFWHYLVYSAGAFTTLGFAKFEAASNWVRAVTTIQAVIGIVLAGLLGFVLGNQIRRS